MDAAENTYPPAFKQSPRAMKQKHKTLAKERSLWGKVSSALT